jgi:hypothetical protein
MELDTPLITAPIFLVGAERSGTTVLRLMLNCHPQITWCNEFEYTVDQMTERDSWPNLSKYYDWLEIHRVFQDTGFVIDRCLNYPQLVNSFLVQRREREEKSIVGATVHRHFDKLLRIWPDARFIHLIRDGRDVARSCIGMGWAGNVWTGSQRWLEAEQLWTRLVRDLPEERYTEIRYETLIKDPVSTLTHLCNFIGVPYDDTMLTYPETTSYSFPNAKYLGQWRRKLSNREIQLVEARIGKMLKERGYELSDLPPLTVTPAIKQQLKLQDWWKRLQFRIQRHGLLLFIKSYLSRRLGLKGWQKQVQLQINAIEVSRLK